MTAKVILNPYSNRWNSHKRWSEAESALKAAGVDFHLAVSEKKGQIVDLTEQAVLQKFSPIIVAGGGVAASSAGPEVTKLAEMLSIPVATALHAKDIMRMKQRLNSILANHTGQPMDKIDRDTDRDYILQANEAVEYGIVDQVIAKRE